LRRGVVEHWKGEEERREREHLFELLCFFVAIERGDCVEAIEMRMLQLLLVQRRKEKRQQAGNGPGLRKQRLRPGILVDMHGVETRAQQI
jgi:hypothetical protein